MKKIIALGTVVSLTLASAQSDLVNTGSIGSPVAPASCNFAPKSQPPITCWTGQKLIFLPKSKDLEHYGYMSFKHQGGDIGDRVSYTELVGKIATVKSVQPGKYSGFDIVVQLDENGKIYEATSYSSNPLDATVDGVAFVREIQAARDALKGKKVWIQDGNFGVYDANTGKVSDIYTKKFQAATIENVTASWYNHSPVRLIVRLPDGRQGFTDVSYFGWNAGTLRDRFAFDRSVFLTDPRLTHKWPKEIWIALENDKIIPGMTKEQVLFSRTQGYTVGNKTTTKDGEIEQWIYKGYGIVTFINGRVSSFSELK